MPLIWAVLKSYSPLLHPRGSICIWQPLAALKLSLTTRLSSYLPSHTPAPYCCATYPCWPTHSSTPPPPHTARPIQPSPTAPSFASVVGSGQEQPQSAPAVQNEGADFTVVNRKKMRKGTTERLESKQHALRGTGAGEY